MKKTNKFSKMFPGGLKAVVCAAIFGSFVFVQGAHLAVAQQRPDHDPAARIKRDIVTKTPIELVRVDGLGGCTNVINDGGFETGGIPSTTWDPETSTNFSTPLCTLAACGNGGGTAGPFAGTTWAWLGGSSTAETATIGQTVTIASGSTATLTFQMRIGSVTAPFTDVLNVKVDGVTVQSFPEPATAEAGYTLRTIDLSSFANGQTHQILFEYIGPGGGTANFNVDNVELNVCSAAVGFTVTGRVTTAAGAPVRGARVTMVQGSTTTTALTNGFGYYTFTEVPAGAAVISASHKTATFGAPLNVDVQADVANADIVAQ